MALNHVQVAVRSLKRNKVFTIVNLLGLSVSITACLLILHYVRFEMSYDNFHANAENVYRVATKVTLGDDVITHETNTYQGISDALKGEYPEIEAATTIRKFTSDRNFIRYEDSNGELIPLQSFQGIETDSTFFDVFSFELLEGNSSNIIALPLVYFAIARWLENYAYKINLGWAFFVVPLILILIIALITISLQTLKVAHRNPVDSLKYD